MKADILLGLQWGDEGKGKIVDVLAPDYDIVARFQGGPNAGHTLEFDGHKHILRSIPSGVFAKGAITNIIGNGVVLDPVLFRKEAAELEADGVDLHEILRISKKAHLIMPTHRLLDAAGEAQMGAGKIGTTGKGIGPTYSDKISRHGLRVGDILDDNFDTIYAAARDRHLRTLKNMDAVIDTEALAKNEQEWLDALEYLRSFNLSDTEHYVNKGACTGLGLAPSRIGKVYGIFKAYCTRVGSGPFPTELFDATGEEIRSIGHEYGAVTGRERRCGWLDLVALRYSVMINGATDLILMKSDVLDTFDTIKVCTAYRLPDGTVTSDFPYCVGHNAEGKADVEPIYDELPGWLTDISAARRESELPQAFRDYIAYIEKHVGVPVSIISVGPDREETIVRS